MQRQVQCLLDANYVLTPATNAGNLPNVIIATVSCLTGPDGSSTGVVSWSGAARAFLTYDMTGTQVLSYTMADQSPAAYQSVENILRAI